MNEYEKENPYAKRVAVVYEIIRNIRWKIPFLPQIVQFLVLSIQLLVLCALYCTIGIVYNCDWLFRKLLAETTEEYKKLTIGFML